MATESPIRMIGSSGTRNWAIGKDTASCASSTTDATAQELALLLQGQGYHGNSNIAAPNRSGSAPPSMEGSGLAISELTRYKNSRLEGIFENLSNAVGTYESEEQIRADPAYHAYYYSNMNLNPRLPQPLMSRENRHLVHRMGMLGESRRMTSFDDISKRSFISRPILSTHREESEDDGSPRLGSACKEQHNSDFVSEQHTSPLQGRHKSLVDLIQEDFPRTPSPVYNNQSRMSSQGTVEQADPDPCFKPSQESPINISTEELQTAAVGIHARTPIPSAHSVGSSSNTDPASALIPCSTSSDVAVSPHPHLKGESSTFDVNLGNCILPSDQTMSNIGSIENEIRSLRLSNDDGHRGRSARQHPQQDNLHPRCSSAHVQIGQPQTLHQEMPTCSNVIDHFSHSQLKSPSAVEPVLQSAGSVPPLYTTAASYGNPYYPSLQPSCLFPPQFSIGGYPLNTAHVPQFITGYPPYTAIHMPFESQANPNFNGITSGLSVGSIAPAADVQHLYRQFGMAGQPSFTDPIYMPYFQQPSVDAYASVGQYDPMASRGSIIGSPAGTYDPQRGSVPTAESLERRPHHARNGGANSSTVRKGGITSPSHSGGPQNIVSLLNYPSSPLTRPAFQGSPVAAGRRNESVRFQINSGRTGGAFSGWQGQRVHEKIDEQKPNSFLEELKSNKSRRYELSDIAGSVVDFIADQHGSRFIQQKLETCSAEEKASVFEEVLPHALTLVTDVFGNYVIQKFFEHGSPVQRKELANKLVGNILPLSLQMYGCRVIQKALEVIELDQKTQIVQELDGHVMRCVRDQNGNHVIQKCIECVPTEKIDFIISSFYGNVAALSMHPYGCRVIQRVLEYCTDEVQSQCIVNEILQSACMLAQDQYGNYVTQHVLERGRPLERSQIISKLAGQIVQMSQHKFASNVIEKCLEHGSPEERDLLIEEILGHTEGNGNLLTLMKDQFANYVIQKMLETCNAKQQNVLLGRITVHLQALKKYTYGKHIVARFEQLCGEVA